MQVNNQCSVTTTYATLFCWPIRS